MRLLEALNIRKSSAPASAEPYRAYVACGFEPLHLSTFVAAHLRLLLPDRNIEISTGQYGDLLGNVRRADRPDVDLMAVVIEWPDLDPRLGVRQLGGWTPAAEEDIVAESRKRLNALESALLSAGRRRRIACSLPTLPLSPFAHTPSWQASTAELELREALYSFASRIRDNTRLVNPQELDKQSPLGCRHDLSSELTSGFPYQLSHTDCLAALLAKLMAPPLPKKALITDLDDCVWSGIVGESGIDGVHWDLDHQSQIHGLYQQLLHSLANSGVLVGVASRNDPKQVERALQRSDLLLKREHLFPVEAHWRRKSESVQRIVQQWNIGYDSVVFVDDSRMELAEVKAAFPDIECMLFPAADVNAAYALLSRLRELFGKEHLLEEDLIRAQSLRQAPATPVPQATDPASSHTTFLGQAQAEITFTRVTPPPDPRALELINKTNQFNLNGKRYQDASWSRRLADPASVHLLTAYRDKFGPLGKIAMLSGRLENSVLGVDTWVMSCRAFGRQIEHGALKHLFDHYPIAEIAFDFVPTGRNTPIQELLRYYVDDRIAGPVVISRELFSARCPTLFHKTKESASD
jgi:FkbH-like protein